MSYLAGIFTALLLVQASWSEELSARITDSTNAAAGEFPYQASVVLKLPKGPERIICGGSILNERWILSSGQCGRFVQRLQGKIKIKVGQHNRNGEGEYVQSRSVSLVIVNKNLKRGPPSLIKDSDIAVIKLKKSLLLNDRVKAIQLTTNSTKVGSKAVMTGFGAVSSSQQVSSVLQKARVTIISSGSCEDAIASISPGNNGRLNQKLFCSGPLDSKITACTGDIGNPLVQQSDEEGVGVQIGIVTWHAFPCGQPGSPTVYTNITSFINWINERITEN